MNFSDDIPDSMSFTASGPEHTTLRNKAEERLGALAYRDVESLGPEETKRLVHELRTNHIEIELQNEDLRRTQVELDAKLTRYSEFYEMAPVGYCTLSEKGSILEANLTTATLLGVARGALIKKSISRFIVNEDQDIYYLHRKQLFQTGTRQSFELRMIKKDDTIFWARLNTTVSHDSAGAPLLLLVLSDITEHRQAIEELRQSEVRLQAANEVLQEQNEELLRLWDTSRQTKDALERANLDLIRQAAELAASMKQVENEKRLMTAVMEALPTGVAITDTSGGALHANKAYETIWGGPRPETHSVKDYSLYKAWWADTERPVAPEEWASAIVVRQGKTSSGQVMRIQRFDGTEAFVINSASPVYDTEGNIVGSAVAIQDVTELKRMERALYESEQRLRLFVEHAPAALAMFDRDMCYLSASRRWLYDYRLGDRDLCGLSIYEVNQRAGRWKEFHRRGLAGEVLKEEEDRYELPDGTIRWSRWEIRPWRNRSGDVGGIVIFAEDITARKRIEKQLQTLNDELEQRVEQRTFELRETQSQYLHAEKLSAIGKLSASIAHEINNPLQGVMAILKGLGKKAILEEEDRKMLDAAIGESERMKNLIRSLQDFNRPSSGKKVVMDVHASIDSLLLLCKSDFKRRKITALLNFAERLPQILAIPDQIKQVFFNLLNNAADACPENGGAITIGTRPEGKRIAVTFQDNGIGIEPEKLELIFQPFYTSKHETQGTGLGLSVCRGIVDRHQGEIRVESRPGEGSTFTVLLPVHGKSDFS